ncbi:WD40 repeat-like protein [Serendipita vermifera]|nr:WD40 repeat-like protein [Serendipita vermifera]
MDRPPWTEHTGPVNSVALSSTGIYVASGSSDKTVGVWEIKPGQNNVRRFRGHTEPVNSVAFSPGGKRVASCSHDKTIRLWDVEARETMGETHMAITEPAISVAFSSDGACITLCFSNGTVRVWNIETGVSFEKERYQMRGNSKAIAFSPGGSDWVELFNQILYWDTSPLAPLLLSNGLGRHVALSGPRVAWEDDQSNIRTCRLHQSEESVFAFPAFKVEEEEVIAKPWLDQKVAIDSLAFSSNGEYLVSGYSNGRIRVWDVEMRRQFGSIMEGDHLYPIESIAVSWDGSCVASGSRDGMIRLWEVQHQMDVCEWKGHADSVRSVALSDDGAYLVSSSDDLSIRVWDLELVKRESSKRKALSIDPKVPRWAMEEGWIIGLNGEHILWIHPLLRPGLLVFYDATVFPSIMTTKLDFSSFVHGESWSLCRET